MLNRIFLVLICLFPVLLKAQSDTSFRFVDASTLDMIGKAPFVKRGTYHRIDSSVFEMLPKRVAGLATNSAGIQIGFQTDSRAIRVRWVLHDYVRLYNMTPLAINGLDLYGWNGEKWQYVSSARPAKDSNDIIVISNLDGRMRHYRLFLPLYSSVKSLEIGVNPQATISKSDKKLLPSRKVVVYGTSITQGASASRPGMAWTSIISREMNIEMFNLGFSGSAKMEPALADVLASMDAEMYILDCVPNMTAEMIRERAIPFVQRLRKFKPNIPILMIESIIREHSHWNQVIGKQMTAQNLAFREVYDQLIKDGFKDIHYIDAKDLMGNDHEATIDGTHLTDLGFMRFSEVVIKELRRLMK